MERKFGWKPSLPTRAKKYSCTFESMTSKPLPEKVDLSPLCSPIEDQGSHGSCVGHGTCGMLEYLELWELRAKLPVGAKAPEVFDSTFDPISRLFVYNNARLYDGNPLSQDNGTQISSAIHVIKNQGLCRESQFAYTDENVLFSPPDEAYLEGLHHKAVWDYKLDNRNLNELKQCLAWGYPIIFGMTCYDSMMTQQVAETGDIPYPSNGDSPVGGHCMLIVGYDNATQTFDLRQSWGLGWGNQGYGKIGFDYLTDTDLASDFWTLRKNSSTI